MTKRPLIISLVLVALAFTGCSMHRGRNGALGSLGPAASPLADSHAAVAPHRNPVVPASAESALAESQEHSPRELRRMQVRSSAAKTNARTSFANCFS